MSIELAIVTPGGQAYVGTVERVVLPGAEGEFAVLEQHERFLAPLAPGPLAIHTAGGAIEWRAVSDGFADVNQQQVVVLVDSCQTPDEIDKGGAESDLVAAEQALLELGQAEETDPARVVARTKLALAKARLEVASHG